jgi:hypothetical protein
VGDPQEPESWVCVDVDTRVSKGKVREEVVNELMISSNSILLVRVKDKPLAYKWLDWPAVDLDNLSDLFVKAVPPKGASHFFVLGKQEGYHVIFGCHNVRATAAVARPFKTLECDGFYEAPCWF